MSKIAIIALLTMMAFAGEASESGRSVRKVWMVTFNVVNPVTEKTGRFNKEHFFAFLEKSGFDTSDIVAVSEGCDKLSILVSADRRILYGTPSHNLLGFVALYQPPWGKLTLSGKVVELNIADDVSIVTKKPETKRVKGEASAESP